MIEVNEYDGLITVIGMDAAARRKLEPLADSEIGNVGLAFEQTPANLRAIMRACAGKQMLMDSALAWLCREPKTIRIPLHLPPLTRTKTTPWHHQLEAAHLALERDGLLLAMDMATGKTKVVIDVAQNMPLEHALRALVVAPKAVVPNWPDEIDCHDASGALCVAVDTAKPVKFRVDQVRRALVETPPTVPLYVAVTHETAWNPAMRELLLAQPWDVIAIDEAHKICEPSNKLSQVCYELARHNPQAKRLALTGTPLKQQPLQVFGIAKFVAPDEVPASKYTFDQKYGVFEDRLIFVRGDSRTIKQFDHLRDEQEFARFMARFMIRVDRSVLTDLPDAVHVRRYVDLPTDAMREYGKINSGMVAEIAGREVAPASAGVKLMRLSQLTGSAKGAALRELLEELNEPLVVFAHFVEDLAIIRKVCDDLGLVYLEQSGARSDWKKFQHGAGNVLGVQEQSGGAGINLTRARTAIFYSYGHSFSVYDQSLARPRRPGTHMGNVTYVHLLARNTVDEDAHFALSNGIDTLRHLISKANAVQRSAAA